MSSCAMNYPLFTLETRVTTYEHPRLFTLVGILGYSDKQYRVCAGPSTFLVPSPLTVTVYEAFRGMCFAVLVYSPPCHSNLRQLR